MKAVRRDREEIEARVSICRVDCVWIVVKVRDAREADGRRASEGRVIDARVYDVPWDGSVYPSEESMHCGHARSEDPEK